MKLLKRISLVQFYLHEEADIEIVGSTAFLGPNGAGKSSTLDAIQIAMLGGNQRYSRLNSQSVSSKALRKLSGYCLGVLRNQDKDSEIISRARDEARTYIILVFGDEKNKQVLSVGICMEASINTKEHEVKGLFVLPGQDLKAADCIVFNNNNKRQPMRFSDFRENAHQRANKISRSMFFTNKSSEYVSELLYALNGQRMPNPKKFMSSFVKSMTLKNVDSIDQFVREYVVESNPVDIAVFRKQVEQFVELRELIIKTKARLSRLVGILSDFKQAKTYKIRVASLKAIEAMFKYEWLCKQIDTRAEKISKLHDKQNFANLKAEKAKKKRELKQKQNGELNILVNKGNDEKIRLKTEIQSNKNLIDAYNNPEIARSNRLINALKDLESNNSFSMIRNKMNSTISILENALKNNQHGKALEYITPKLKRNYSIIQERTDELYATGVREFELISDEITSTHNQISAIKITGRLLNKGAALLLELLNRAGIKAQPISALAKITNEKWSPVLEAYLGEDRDALVITEGNAYEAIKVFKKARINGKSIEGASIVQPNHLCKVEGLNKNIELAIDLFDSDNETALKFLNHKFGDMRIIENETELENYSQAITKEGMISNGGLLKVIPLIPLNALSLGKKVHESSGLLNNLSKLQDQIKELNKWNRRLKILINSMFDSNNECDSETKIKLTKAIIELNKAKHLLDSFDYNHLEENRVALEEGILEWNKLDVEYTNSAKLTTSLEIEVKNLIIEKQKFENKLPSIRKDEDVALTNQFVNKELIDKLKNEIESSEVHYETRMNEVEKKLIINNSRLKSYEERASMGLLQYTQDERLDVQIINMKSHEKHSWAIDEKHKLSDTHLQNYESQAEQARDASEEMLRSDIAMSLYDRIKEMDMESRERNKILDSCPAFTGGERFQFTKKVVPHYEPFVRYIKQIANNEKSGFLFSENIDGINETLNELIQAAADSDNASAVLDYRQFFSFDLDILVDGKKVDKMSKRQGVGSNGEHIVPMYIAAGSALAKAYRLHNRKNQENGIGLICLDEAFHGMDTINAITTARFLQSIGLQLIMAGHELELVKLSPVSQTIYDLDREGLDLQMIKTKFKPASNELMISDMPEENPQIVADAFKQLKLELPIKPIAEDQ